MVNSNFVSAGYVARICVI